MPLPGRAALPVAEQTCSAQVNIEPRGDHVDRVDRQPIWSTCPARKGSSICSSSAPRAARAPGLAFSTAAIARTRSALAHTVAVMNPAGERERTGERELDGRTGLGGGEGEVVGQTER